MRASDKLHSDLARTLYTRWQQEGIAFPQADLRALRDALNNDRQRIEAQRTQRKNEHGPATLENPWPDSYLAWKRKSDEAYSIIDAHSREVKEEIRRRAQSSTPATAGDRCRAAEELLRRCLLIVADQRTPQALAFADDVGDFLSMPTADEPLSLPSLSALASPSHSTSARAAMLAEPGARRRNGRSAKPEGER